MPGLFGIIKYNDSAICKEDLSLMIKCANHEPFYNTGNYINENLGLYVGWTAHKDSFSDCMPLEDPHKNFIIFFSGEDFSNDKPTIKLDESHLLSSSSNKTGYLIDSYAQNSNDFFVNLNGFFHGLIIDLQKNNIIIFNDRYGMLRLYYYQTKDEFIFASEAKTILKIRPFLRSINLDSLGEYFCCGCVLENKTLFKNIFLLPGGSKWAFKPDNSVDKKLFFKPDTWENQPSLKPSEFVDQFNTTFTSVVPRYFRGNQNIGLSLTGGLDTRMILSAADLTPMSFPCYTYGGMYRDSYDVLVSREVAKACNQQHSTLKLESDFLSNFPDYVEKTIYLSDGIMDITGAPNLYVSRLAREIAPVRLTGNYGQEVLRGYIAFRPNPTDINYFNKDFLQYIEKAKSTYNNNVANTNQLTFSLFKQAPWFQFSRFSVENSQLTQRTPFMDNEIVGLVYRAALEDLIRLDISKHYIQNHSPSIGSIMTDLGNLGNLPNSITKVVKAWRFFLFKMEWYYNHRLHPAIEPLDNFLSFLNLENWFVGRNKYYHMRIWFRDHVSEYLKDTLLDHRSLSRDFINGDYLSKAIEQHIDKNRSKTDLICTALSAELMHRQFIDHTII